jgi:hypothetical protein
MDILKGYTTKKYDDLGRLLIASMEADELEEDLTNCYIGGVDADNELHEITYERWEESIREQGVWGFIDEVNVIHYWLGKELTVEELIHFFAHEIGHNNGVRCEDFLEEEKRAETYAYVAKLAYKMAINNK